MSCRYKAKKSKLTKPFRVDSHLTISLICIGTEYDKYTNLMRSNTVLPVKTLTRLGWLYKSNYLSTLRLLFAGTIVAINVKENLHYVRILISKLLRLKRYKCCIGLDKNSQIISRPSLNALLNNIRSSKPHVSL